MSRSRLKTNFPAGVQVPDKPSKHRLPTLTEGNRPPDLRAIIVGALDERWRTVVRDTKRARSRPTEKSVHDLRVAFRRLMAALDIVRMVTPNSGATKLRKQLHAYLKSLSALRDTQVQIIETESLVKEYPDSMRFLKSLRREETVRSKQAAKEILKIDPESMKSSFERIATKTEDLLISSVMRKNAQSILRGMLAKLYVRTVVLRKQIQNSDRRRIDFIHELRLVYKRFRYSVEILHPVLPLVSEPLMSRMNEYQKSLGAIHDKAVLQSVFDSYLKGADGKERKHRDLKAGQFSKLCDSLSKNVEEEINRFLIIMDEIDDFWKHLK